MPQYDCSVVQRNVLYTRLGLYDKCNMTTWAEHPGSFLVGFTQGPREDCVDTEAEGPMNVVDEVSFNGPARQEHGIAKGLGACLQGMPTGY